MYSTVKYLVKIVEKTVTELEIGGTNEL